MLGVVESIFPSNACTPVRQLVVAWSYVFAQPERMVTKENATTKFQTERLTNSGKDTSGVLCD